MKKNLLFLFAAYCSVTNNTVFAQAPTLTNVNPTLGGSFTVEGTNTYTSPGTSGTDQTWDFSTLTGSSGGTTNFVAPSSTPNSSSFPAATISGYNSTSAVYSYFKTSSTKLESVGSVSSIVLPYSDPEELMRYPFQYTDTFTDTWRGNFSSGGMTYLRRGTVTVTADGYGTVILPSGTYTDVMRIHFVEVYSDSTYFAGGPYIINYNNDQYMWYKDGIFPPVITSYTLSSDAAANPFVGTSYVTAAPFTAIAENDATNVSFSVYPNPSNGQFTVKAENGMATNCQLEIFNNVAERVFQSNTKQFSNSTIDLSALPKGLYFLKISSDDKGDSVQKLVIQ